MEYAKAGDMNMVLITLDSMVIDGDSIDSFEKFISDLDISDLLTLNKIVTDETNKRLEEIYQERKKGRR